jgi:lipoate-protein ligase A
MKRNSRFTRIVLAGGIVAASGGAALGLTSIASAALTGDSEALVLVAEAEQATSTPAALAGVQGVVNSAGIAKPRFASETLAEALGMTVEELHEALRSGKSIAVIAEEQGKDLEAVKFVMLAEFSAHLDQHVADGDITREQADERLAKFTERLDELVNKTRPERGEGGRGPGRIFNGLKEASAELAAVLDLTEEELRTQLRSGKSLAAIAEAQGVDIDDVKKVLTDEFTAHLAEHVAEGKITQEQADARLEQFTERLDDMVNKSLPERGEGRRGRGGRHGFGGRHGGETPESPEAPESEGTGLSA